jgi:hypothetical protein
MGTAVCGHVRIDGTDKGLAWDLYYMYPYKMYTKDLFGKGGVPSVCKRLVLPLDDRVYEHIEAHSSISPMSTPLTWPPHLMLFIPSARAIPLHYVFSRSRIVHAHPFRVVFLLLFLFNTFLFALALCAREVAARGWLGVALIIAWPGWT